MPTSPAASRHLRRRAALATRSQWFRTNGDMLTGGPDPDWWDGGGGSGINPGDGPPVIGWYGTDHFLPNGPYGPRSSGFGPALPVVTRATQLITGPLTAAPFREIDLADGHPLGRARWITDPMAMRQDSRIVTDVYPAVSKLPRGQFWAEWIRAAIWWGVGAFVCQEDATGQPLAGTLRLINPLMLTTERDDNGVLHWVLGAEGPDDEKAVFDRDGFLHLGPVTLKLVTLRNPLSPVDSEGHSMGCFERSPQAFKLEGQIGVYSSGVFRSGIPSGYLQVTGAVGSSLTQEQATDLKQSWMNNHGGDRRSIAVLNAQTSFVPLNLSPVDAALGEVKRLSIADVAFAMGLDPDVLGAGLSNSSTYRNATEFWQRHRDFSLAEWISGVEDTLSALLPGTQGVKVNLDGFANPPLSERVSTGAAAVAAGLMDIDEWRAIEGLPPRPVSADTSADQSRAVSQQDAVQKVYLGVVNGVISVPEARQMINDAGGNLDVQTVPSAPTA